jgi:hypothetical protein
MPRLFNTENLLFQTVAVASMASNASKTATFTGITTADYVCVLYNNDSILTTETGLNAAVTAANVVMFTPAGCSGGATAVAQTVGLMGLKSPTSGQNGGSW